MDFDFEFAPPGGGLGGVCRREVDAVSIVDAGVVDEDVNVAVLGFDGGECRRHRFFIGSLEGDGEYFDGRIGFLDQSFRLFKGLEFAGSYDDFSGTRRCEGPGNTVATNTSGCSSDHDDLSCLGNSRLCLPNGRIYVTIDVYCRGIGCCERIVRHCRHCFGLDL